MNKKGFSEKELLKIITIIVGLILLYLIYKAITSQLKG